MTAAGASAMQSHSVSPGWTSRRPNRNRRRSDRIRAERRQGRALAAGYEAQTKTSGDCPDSTRSPWSQRGGYGDRASGFVQNPQNHRFRSALADVAGIRYCWRETPAAPYREFFQLSPLEIVAALQKKKTACCQSPG